MSDVFCFQKAENNAEAKRIYEAWLRALGRKFLRATLPEQHDAIVEELSE
jgi:hypothetical protein